MSLILILALLTIALPAGSIVWLWRAKNSNKVEWQVKASIAAGVVIFAFVALPWALISYYLRFVFPALFLLSAYASYSKTKYRPIFVKMNEKWRLGFSIQIAVFLAILAVDALTIKGYFFKGAQENLSFPLRDGTYYVLQGGASPFTNPFHRKNPAEFYALDIVRLNAFGNRAKGLRPSMLSEYAVNGATVHSPCAGKVKEAVGGFPDNAVNTVDRKNPAGNHIVIGCGGIDIWLAHLRKDSILVKKGAGVREGQPVAQAGNSGNSIEPHLHIHAVKGDGSNEAVPVVFDGKFLSTNSVVIVK